MDQTFEHPARKIIDRQLSFCEWVVQNKKQINLVAGVRLADYVLFIDKQPIDIIEAKKEEGGCRLT